jgi:SOS-response transcriptional repressor LexA
MRNPKVWPLTERQREVIDAIRELSANGRAPSIEELGERVGLRGSWATRRHLSILEKKGILRPRRYGRPRDIVLIEGGGGALAA